MKKGFAFIYVLIVFVFIGIFSIPIISTIKKNNEREESLLNYVEDANKQLSGAKEEVSDGIKYNFNVLEDNGTTLKLLMNKNLGGNVAWASLDDSKNLLAEK